MDRPLSHHSRRTHIGLLALVVVTVLFAAGALFVKYKLEGLRGVVHRQVELRTGAQIEVGAVVVNGLRGLRLDHLEATLDIPGGPTVEVNAPAAYIDINLADLLSRTVTIDQVQADHMLIRLRRSADRPWIAQGAERAEGTLRMPNTAAFRVVGQQCELEILQAAGEKNLTLSDLAFDVSRHAGSPNMTAELSGKLAPDTSQEFKVDLRFASIEDFDLRVQCPEIKAQDVTGYLPAFEHVIRSGMAAPRLRIAGYPGLILSLAFETPFRNLTIENQPEFIESISGTLSGVATYDSGRRLLTVNAAKADSDQLAGRLEGSIAFAEESPVFDLRLDATRVPVEQALSYVMKDRAQDYGTFNFTPHEPYEIYVTLKGPASDPAIAFHAGAGAGEFSFAPKDPALPVGRLQLGPMTFAWGSDSPIPQGSFTILSGTIKHAGTGLAAERISGTLVVDDKRVNIDPLNADITGNPLVGRLAYDSATGRLECSVNGTLAEIEQTPLAHLDKDLSLAGAVSLRGKLVRSEGVYVIDAEVGATQAEIGFEDWFLKPSGMGAQVQNIHVEATPRKKITITGEAELAHSHIGAEAEIGYKKKWKLQTVQASTSALDVDAAGQCIRFPYKITGGKGTNMKFDWVSTEPDPGEFRMTISGDFDTYSMLPEGGETPMRVEDVHAEFVNTGGTERKRNLLIRARKGKMPAIREPWFVPWKRDRPEKDEDKHDDLWTFDLAGDALEIPPWKAAHFEGQAYTSDARSGLDQFKASLDTGGTVEGAYTNLSNEHAYDLTMKWNDAAASYLLDQLQYPRVLSGTTTGDVAYHMDQESGALTGRGAFVVRNGQFSADFLISQLQGRLEDKITSLPSSLRFSELKTDLVFEGNRMRTDNLQLIAEGLKISGNGTYVFDGDLDYDLKVAVAPSVAEQIPILRDNFSLQGLRLAQQDVELAFKVKGPLGKPRGELSEFPPLGITLVSSALEVTSDAVRVIDIPRKIFVDLLRIGGGIVGMKK